MINTRNKQLYKNTYVNAPDRSQCTLMFFAIVLNTQREIIITPSMKRSTNIVLLHNSTCSYYENIHESAQIKLTQN